MTLIAYVYLYNVYILFLYFYLCLRNIQLASMFTVVKDRTTGAKDKFREVLNETNSLTKDGTSNST